MLIPKIIFYTTSKIDDTKLDYYENEIYGKADYKEKKIYKKDMDNISRLRNYNDEYLSLEFFMTIDGVFYRAAKFSDENVDYLAISFFVDFHKTGIDLD